MIREILKKFALLFSSKLKEQPNTLQQLRKEEKELNSKLETLEKMQDQLKDANK